MLKPERREATGPSAARTRPQSSRRVASQVSIAGAGSAPRRSPSERWVPVPCQPTRLKRVHLGTAEVCDQRRERRLDGVPVGSREGEPAVAVERRERDQDGPPVAAGPTEATVSARPGASSAADTPVVGAQ